MINGQSVEIDSFGLFHIFLGDLTPSEIDVAKQGGHIFLPDLKLQTHKVENFQNLKDGYFSLNVKHIEDNGWSVLKTFFPFGKTPLECVKIMIDAIKNPKAIDILDSQNSKKIGIKILNQNDQIFKLFIDLKSKRATFYPEG